MKTTSIALLLAVITGCAATPSTPQEPVPDLAGVRKITAIDLSDSMRTYHCTATFVSTTVAITAAHCLGRHDSEPVVNVQDAEGVHITATLIMRSGGYRSDDLEVSTRSDWALVQFDAPVVQAKDVYTLAAYQDSQKILTSVGYPVPPFDSNQERVTSQVVGVSEYLIQHDAELGTGYSGGPLLVEGRVVGINTQDAPSGTIAIKLYPEMVDALQGLLSTLDE